jgi:transcriptional regulator with XRE-family HTH domain
MRGRRDTLGKRLLRLRTKAGLSVSELARTAGLKSPSHIGLIERGERVEIAAQTALALSKTLGVSVEWLVNGEGDEPTEDAVKTAVERAAKVAA